MSEPSIERVERILVVGSGTMGSQIGMVCALAGYDVCLHDISERMLEQGRVHLRDRVMRIVEKGRLRPEQVAGAFDRLSFTTDFRTAASAVDFVIEAAVEKLAVKREIFRKLDETVPEHAVLTTNSSWIVSSRVASVTDRPDQVCNMHFFNPALVMECVEVMPNPDTSGATVTTTAQLARRIGKTPVILRKEIPGFIANRILGAARDEAISLYESGVASPEDIDIACKTALAYPMGPFELMDLVGLDVSHDAKIARYEQSGDPNDRPSRSVADKVGRGELGRKTGRGWYVYDEAGRRQTR